MAPIKCPEDGCPWQAQDAGDAVTAVLLTNHLKVHAKDRSNSAATVIGRLAICELGVDKVRRIKKFSDWIGEAESKMRLLNIKEGQQKKDFIQSGAGPELTRFWEKEARIQFEKQRGTKLRFQRFLRTHLTILSRKPRKNC